MKLLLDTHALLWWAHEPENLSSVAREAIADGGNAVHVSAVSALEIATKNRTGKLEYNTLLAEAFVREVERKGFEIVSISAEHGQRAGAYVWSNKDPWDRLLAAQAEVEELALVTIDRAFRDIAVRTLW